MISERFYDFIKQPPKELPSYLKKVADVISKDGYSDEFLESNNVYPEDFDVKVERIIVIKSFDNFGNIIEDYRTIQKIPSKSWEQLVKIRYRAITDEVLGKMIVRNIKALLKYYSGSVV
jgi:hypothetical protein